MNLPPDPRRRRAAMLLVGLAAILFAAAAVASFYGLDLTLGWQCADENHTAVVGTYAEMCRWGR